MASWMILSYYTQIFNYGTHEKNSGFEVPAKNSGADIGRAEVIPQVLTRVG